MHLCMCLCVYTHCRWWWRSFLCGGSTGIFIFGYCFYYYFARSDMSGLMQVRGPAGVHARPGPHRAHHAHAAVPHATRWERYSTVLVVPYLRTGQGISVRGCFSQCVSVCVRAHCADKFLLRLQRASVLRLPHDVRLCGIQSITYVRVPYIQV